MLCEICKQNEATVFYKEIINDKQRDLQLCEKCAQEKGILTINQISITNLLGGLVEPGSIAPQEVELRCKNCGLSYPGFCERGKFGCSECYQAPSQTLPAIFRTIRGSTRRTGKHPATVSISPKIEDDTATIIVRLRGELQAAITAEEFEKAAELRDMIKAMEQSEIVPEGGKQ